MYLWLSIIIIIIIIIINFAAGVDGYRPLYIPKDTAAKFEEVASPNTRKNVETCGILAGKLVR